MLISQDIYIRKLINWERKANFIDVTRFWDNCFKGECSNPLFNTCQEDKFNYEQFTTRLFLV